MSQVTRGFIGKQDFKLYDGTSSTTFNRNTVTGGTESLNRVDWVGVDVLEVYGNGTDFTDATIRAAIANVGSTRNVKFRLISGTWLISSSLTIGSNIILMMEPGAVLTDDANNANLTINGDIIASPKQQIINWGNGSGTVTHPDGISIYSSWHGSLADCIADIPSTCDIEIKITESETISANLTVTDNFRLNFIKGNILSDDANNADLTINGDIIAADTQQIFDWGNGSGVITYKNGTEIYQPWHGSLAECIADIPSTCDIKIKISESETISSNLTVTYNFEIEFINGNILSDDANNATLTIQGDIDDGLFQKFNWGDGTGEVNFSGGRTKRVYPEWWGALGPNESFNATTNRNAINYACSCGSKNVFFNHLFTVNGNIGYDETVTYEGRGIEIGTAGINFIFTATGDLSLFYPNTGRSQNCIFKNLRLEIDATSDFGTSGWEVVLHDHGGGRWQRTEGCYYKNNVGSDDGGGNYYSVGSKYYYVASPAGYCFNIWIYNNIWNDFDTDLWANGDDTIGADLGLCIGWSVQGNHFGSINTSNTDVDYANFRIDAGNQIRIIDNTFVGTGVSGGTGFPNITISDESTFIHIIANYYEGGPSGRLRIYLNDEADKITIYDAMFQYGLISDNTSAGYGNHSIYGSDRTFFGNVRASHDNEISIQNEYRVLKSANYNLQKQDSGQTYWSNTDGIVFTLPPTEPGLIYRIENFGGDGTVQINVSPNPADRIFGLGTTGGDDKDIYNTKATSVFGDTLEIQGDGKDGWYVVKARGIWAFEV